MVLTMNKNSQVLGQKFDVPKVIFLICTLSTAIIVIFVVGVTFIEAFPTFTREGLSFITGSVWDYDNNDYGILPLIGSTLIMTFITMLIAIPMGVLTAIFLAEFAPVWLKKIMRPMIELLVGIPSVVYGVLGFYVIGVFMQSDFNPLIINTLGFIPIFKGMTGARGNILLASVVLAIMVLPTITALSEEAIRSVPEEYRHASYALGSTKYEVLRNAVLPVAVPGVLSAIVLGIMRAMGETMAVVMLIGDVYQIPASVFDRGYAMTSYILTQMIYNIGFDEPRSALFGIAAVLFAMELAMLLLAKLILNYRIIHPYQTLIRSANGFIDYFKGGIKDGAKSPKP